MIRKQWALSFINGTLHENISVQSTSYDDPNYELQFMGRIWVTIKEMLKLISIQVIISSTKLRKHVWLEIIVKGAKDFSCHMLTVVLRLIQVLSAIYLGCCPLPCCWSHPHSRCWSQWKHWRHCWLSLFSGAGEHKPVRAKGECTSKITFRQLIRTVLVT